MNDASVPNILVGTPAYAGQVHVDYVHTLMGLYRVGLRFSLMTVDRESLITRARNAIISRFHALSECTHLLFLDGDVHVGGEDVVRLLSHGRDVTGAPVPLKGRDENGRPLYNTGRVLRHEGELVVTDRVGTAVLALSRAAVGALIDDAGQRGGVYSTSSRYVRDDGEAIPQYDVFQVGVVEGEYLSEDFWVCHRLRALGYEVFVDPAISVRHHGPAVFAGAADPNATRRRGTTA